MNKLVEVRIRNHQKFGLFQHCGGSGALYLPDCRRLSARAPALCDVEHQEFIVRAHHSAEDLPGKDDIDLVRIIPRLKDQFVRFDRA